MVSEEKVVFVGGKPFMNYVTAVVMQFSTNGADNVVIRSRGKFISRAVDVAEMVRSKFLTDSIEIGKVNIAAEDFKNKEGRPIRVSTIDIHLNKLNGVTPTPTNFELRRSKSEAKEEQKPEEKAEETVKEPVSEETSEAKEETVDESTETLAEESVAEPEPTVEEPISEPIADETPFEPTPAPASEPTEQTSLESETSE